ncbi:hypothetical protein E4T80_11815 [Muribacter muris]|uniref:Uncharacterized protein n=1 Tax=Muribacter muris TaxID=67855 RepID=A0A4Y9JQG8_9PAST|nr:hypothetical protein [Muribacter muris]MBF0786146.1 hypothetical protein [Muribacter muris]MBF0827333.1 hypothetical protein [Muribacter muris]TFV07818.1 hypothetical protein E4T80_11815 [Muribacter muris]
MLFKEKGYDEYLSQKIAKGREELEAGKGIPLDQAKILVRATIEETAQDLADFERSVAYA